MSTVYMHLPKHVNIKVFTKNLPINWLKNVIPKIFDNDFYKNQALI